VPEALLTIEGSKPVIANDVLPILGEPGRNVQVLDITLDPDGGLLVQEVYRIDPARIGCVYQEPRFIMDMQPEEADELLDFLRRHTTDKDAGEQTVTFARPIFKEMDEALDEGGDDPPE